MPKKAKFGFGSSSNVEQALQDGKINARDIVFLDENTDNPKVGWVTSDGKIVTAKADLSEVEAEITTLESTLATKANASDVEALEGQIATKVDATEVNAKVGQAVTEGVASANAYTDKMVEAAMGEHLTKKYEIASVPEGTLVDYREKEIRVMCPDDAVFTKQTVGAGGDANTYYLTLKTYVYDDNIVGYKEHLGDQVDEEILTDLKTDTYGRRYQPTWLALAKYDEATDTWAYYGKSSSVDKYIGWDYQIDFYNADGVMIASDSIRINLSNEGCHSSIEPYYVGTMRTEVETMIEEKVAEVNSAYEIIEF